MGQNITFLGEDYVGVSQIELPLTGGGTAVFSESGGGGGGSATLITKSITANGTYDAEDDSADGYSQVTVAVPSGIGTLLATSALGTISTTSTSATDSGKSLTVSDVNDYDLLVVETSVDSVTNNRHVASVGLIFLTGTSTVDTKNTAAVGSNKYNVKVSSSGVYTTRQSTTAYGIYPNSATLATVDSKINVTIPLYMRYHSTNTGTINGSYTTRVYGINLFDLIGG